MLYSFNLLDRPDSGALRQAVRPQHKAYLAQVAERIAVAGPLLADDGQTMIGSLLVIDFPTRAAAQDWLAQEPFNLAGLYSERRVQAFSNLWPQNAGRQASLRHIVMWKVRGETPAERHANIEQLRKSFDSLRGRVPGLMRLEIGVDSSRVEYACDVALYSEFDTQASLDAYASHPEHLRVKEELGAMRIARHQVDYAIAAT